VKQDFNESQVLSKLIYSHFLFVMLRAMSFFFPPEVADPMLSIIFSLDTILVVLIYFLPKFLANDEAGVMSRASTRISGLNFSGASNLRESANHISNDPSFQFNFGIEGNHAERASSNQRHPQTKVKFRPESVQRSSDSMGSGDNFVPTERTNDSPLYNDVTNPREEGDAPALEKISEKLYARANR